MSSNQQNNNGKQKAFFQEWLEKLQQESWQLELLISGFALYGIYESRSFIQYLSNKLLIGGGEGFSTFVSKIMLMVMEAGWTIFFINLLIHIILRGLWIGAIGLRYVSNEIEYDKLNYSEWMTSYLKRKVGNYDDYIERLERLCSVIFAYTFLLFFLILSAMVFLLSIALVFFVIETIGLERQQASTMVGVFVLFYVLLGSIVFVDFVTIGIFRKVKDPIFSKVYGHLYRFYSFVTLSFMYRALLYNFLDNKYTRRLFLGSIPYVILVVFLLPSVSSSGFAFYPDLSLFDREERQVIYQSSIVKSMYSDLTEKGLSTGAISHRSPIYCLSIDKYTQSTSLMKVFVRMLKSDEDYLSSKSGITPLSKEGVLFSFRDNTVVDSAVLAIEASRNDLVAPVVEQRRKDRQMLKDLGVYGGSVKDSFDIAQDLKVDSIDAIIAGRVRVYRARQVDNVMDAMLCRTEMSIDGEPVALQTRDCLFMEHYNLGERGILCHLDISRLALGRHDLLVQRYGRDYKGDGRDSPVIDQTIPFIVDRPLMTQSSLQ